MKVYQSIDEFVKPETPVVTTGTFDGVHKGHQKIISRLKEVAQKNNGETVVLTFYPHPRMVLFPDDTNLKFINTQEEKIALLKHFGVDHLIIQPFTKEFSRLSSVEFVRNILANRLGVKKLVIGYDHQFGRNREGAFEHLKEYGPLYGFEVEEIPAEDVNHIRVSSTKIRDLLSQGNIEAVNAYLGYDFSISGNVIKGKKMGRSIGFPTANIRVNDKHKLIPADGVYAVTIKHNNTAYKGMLNIGHNPTVNGIYRSVEVNIFDFHEDIYDQLLTVSFHQRLRNEIKFDTLDKLKEQLISDKERSLEILS